MNAAKYQRAADVPSALSVLPTRSVFEAGDSVQVQIVGGSGADLSAVVYHLGDRISQFSVVGSTVDVGPLPIGGYGVEIVSGDVLLGRTAVEVVGDRRSRLRYGFVVDYRPDRDPAEVAVLARRLHLTAVQFYDWAFRHADLLGGGNGAAEYADALGQPVALNTVRTLVAALRAVGTDSLGYAAVYGVGTDAWPVWQHDALLTPSGTPWGLGDFLNLVDPAAADWCAHFVADLEAAADHVGFDGFHLDQYGYPKRAVRPDGVVVDLAESFDAVIRAARDRLPNARLVFNNVNDFPSWRTASSPQDATYIEVWPPHVTLADLADVVLRARAAAPDRPVVIAAYQSVYAANAVETADSATALTMATLFSHGATQLLAGEGGRLLVDPYYVRNHQAEPATLKLLTRWYDFLVEHGELMLDPTAVEVTGSYAGDYNGDLDVRYPSTRVTGNPIAGAVWRRIVEVDGTLVVHLINLVGQRNTLWDAPRQPTVKVAGGELRFRRIAAGVLRVQVADPDCAGPLGDCTVRVDGDYAVVILPELAVWQFVVVNFPTTERR